jgi:hypothetical protein
MAKVPLRPWLIGTKVIEGFRDKLGNIVFRQSPSGETIVSKAPDISAVIWSPVRSVG